MPEQDISPTRDRNRGLYVLVVVCEAGVVAVLWMFGRIYG